MADSLPHFPEKIDSFGEAVRRDGPAGFSPQRSSVISRSESGWGDDILKPVSHENEILRPQGSGRGVTETVRGNAGRRREAVHSAVLRWFDGHRRDLPWRRTSDPYRIWVAETMLQQTRIPTVLPYYERFVARFPDVEVLARAPLEEVLRLWSGLGYYSRGRNLHRAARMVVEEHGGKIPASYEEIRRLPGVGAYTAGAILSIAYRLPYPVVDGNVSRVLSRFFRVEGDPRSAAVSRLLWEKARRLLSPGKPGDFNQALMEIGSLICTPRRPRCLLCPLKRWCRAQVRGEQEAYPQAAPRPPMERERSVRALIRRRGRLLLHRRSDSRRLAGLWEFPGGPCPDGEDPGKTLARHLKRMFPFPVEVEEELGEVKHHIARRQIRSVIFWCRSAAGAVMDGGGEEWRWVLPGEVARYPLGAADLKVLDLLERGRGEPLRKRRRP